MKRFGCVLLLLALSGCYCMPEPGDEQSYEAYKEGCWAATKGNKG